MLGNATINERRERLYSIVRLQGIHPLVEYSQFDEDTRKCMKTALGALIGIA